MDLAVFIEKAHELGFGDVGLCAPVCFSEQERIVNTQPPLQERRQLRFAPAADVPWASAIAVLLWPYAPAAYPQDEDEVFVDSYYFASNAAYHASKALEEWLIAQGYEARANVSYPAREAAVRAGLGLIGHNGMLIHPKFGTRTVIILLATNAFEAQAMNGEKRKKCVECKKCITACPTGAIDENGMTHPERCLRNYMMEGIVAPEDVRVKMGMKLIGCDNCQRACPMQPAWGNADQTRFFLDEFMQEDETAFRSSVARLGNLIGRNAARPQRVRAQAALLAGNRKKQKDMKTVTSWAASPFEAVREHAVWAMGQIGTCIEGIDQNDQKR